MDDDDNWDNDLPPLDDSMGKYLFDICFRKNGTIVNQSMQVDAQSSKEAFIKVIEQIDDLVSITVVRVGSSYR